ncbi:MAG TPA: hypothetical protein VIS71_07590 [Terrimicrobium sp.]
MPLSENRNVPEASLEEARASHLLDPTKSLVLFGQAFRTRKKSALACQTTRMIRDSN